jgi:hypothetical protein
MSSKIERLELFRHKSGVGRLGILIAEISQALEQGRLLDAFRLSDCACRIAPEDATCLLIHAKLLTRIGKGAEAALRLSGRTEPALMVARGLALCQQGLFDEAAPIGEWALSRFAVDTLDGAEQLAFTLCSNGGAAKPHLWVGIDSKLRLVGLISSGFRPTFSMPDKDLQAEFFPSSQDGFQSFRVTIPFGSSGFVTANFQCFLAARIRRFRLGCQRRGIASGKGRNGVGPGADVRCCNSPERPRTAAAHRGSIDWRFERNGILCAAGVLRWRRFPV